jgi:hypothetical protein
MTRILFALFALSWSTLYAAAATPAEASVPIYAGPSYGGSGTVIAAENGKSLVVTAKHVVEGRTPIVIGELNGPKIAATLLAMHPTADMALIVVNAKLPAATLAVSAPKEGTTVVLYGYPADRSPRLWKKTGRWAGYVPFDGGMAGVTRDFVSISGDSGGGVFAGNTLVGVHHSTRQETPDYGLNATHTDIRDLVEEKAGEVFPNYVVQLVEENDAQPLPKPMKSKDPAPASPYVYPPPGTTPVAPPVQAAPVMAAAPAFTMVYHKKGLGGRKSFYTCEPVGAASSACAPAAAACAPAATVSSACASSSGATTTMTMTRTRTRTFGASSSCATGSSGGCASGR